MRLLIGYDGSQGARNAIDDLRAAGLSQSGEAVLLTVVETPFVPQDRFSVEAGCAVPDLAARLNGAVADAEEIARDGDARLRTVLPTWNVRDEVAVGSPYRTLASRADELDAELIVVGSRGRSALGGMMLGSVSQSLLYSCRRSLRIGRGGSTDAAPRAPRILLGYDGSDSAASAAEAICERHWPPGTEVRIVAALARCVVLLAAMPPGMRFGDPWPSDDEPAYVRRMLDAAAAPLRECGLGVTTHVAEGDPKQALIEEAARWGAGTIFVGSHGSRGLPEALLGSVALSVASRAGCSVEVVRPRGR